ncbi:hypothetical protein PBI_SCTP2_258 [Salicola phage SCTP-2]|nr:hypothetical protein PBI_SCTP2_258 [Salicola phage SCTP-2]
MVFSLIKSALIVMLGIEKKTIRVFHLKNKIWKEIGQFSVFVNINKYYENRFYELSEDHSEVLHEMKVKDHLHKVRAVTEDGKVITYNEKKLTDFLQSKTNIINN